MPIKWKPASEEELARRTAAAKPAKPKPAPKAKKSATKGDK